jgi:hypothetical protein
MSAAVDVAYRHYPKTGRLAGLREADGTVFKLYHLTSPDAPVPDDVARLCEDWFEAEAAAVADPGDHGFVLLHRCGADFYFLLVSVWRGSNELWEAVWYRHSDMPAFAPFDPAYPGEAGAARPTFCVWELGIVAHEAQAWGRYLASSRGDTDLAVWRADIFEGPV